MFSHVMVGCSDLDRSRRFYDAVFGTLGVGPGHLDRHRIFWRSKTGVFAATLPINGEPQTVGNGGTIGFKCESPEQVTQFHDVAVAHGGTSVEDPPGPRQGALGTMHLAYVRDPDGNKLCALHRPK
jgi:catechol 2,3-dioxygenase-like lactoylglutathione lyase family enzyme